MLARRRLVRSAVADGDSSACDRRDFLQLLAAAAAAGLPLDRARALDLAAGARFYDVAPFGNVSLLHFTDCHAQLAADALPRARRQPRRRRRGGQAAASRRRGAAQALRHRARARARRTRSRISTSPRRRAAYGTIGGFAHLATLVKQLRASRPDALLLDGGDTLAGLGDRAVDARART